MSVVFPPTNKIRTGSTQPLELPRNGKSTLAMFSRQQWHAIAVITSLLVLLFAVLGNSLGSVSLTIVTLIALALADLRAVLVLAYPIFSLTGTVLSVLLIENGTYISEQSRYGFNVGATSWLACYSIAFIITAHILISILAPRLARRHLSAKTKTLDFFIVTTCVFVSLYYSVIFTIYGTGLQYASRFDWLDTLPGIAQTVHGLIGTFVIPSAYAAAGIRLTYHKRPQQFWFVLFLPLPIICLFATGEKFSGFISTFTLFLLGLGIGAYLTGKRIHIRPRYILPLLAGIALIFSSLFYGYQRMGSVNIIEAISERLALQGHVWFGIFERFSGRPFVSLEAIIGPNSHDYPAGLDLLSYYVASPDYVYGRIGRGVTFTMGGPPSALAAFGLVLGLIIYAATSLMYVATALIIIEGLRRRNYIVAICGVFLTIMVSFATQMGRWDSLYGTVSLLSLATLVILPVIKLTAAREMTRTEFLLSKPTPQ